MLLISLLSFACLATHLALQRSWANPGVIHGVIWLLVSLGYVALQGELNIVSGQTLFTLALGIAAFSMGIYAGGRLIGFDLTGGNTSSKHFPVPAIIVLVSAAGFAMMAGKAIQFVPFEPGMSLFGGSDSWYTQLRNDLIAHRQGSFGISSYVLNVSFAGAACLILYYRRLNNTRWLWPGILLALGFALLSTGRTYLVLLGCLVLGAAMPMRKRTWTTILLVSPLFIVAATWLGGRFELASSSVFWSSFAIHAKKYFVAAVGSFDYLVNADFPQTWGSMTFRTPVAVMRAIGLPIDVPALIQPWAPTRISVNVYTVFSPYYRDFGVIGVGIFMLLLGALHGWIFRQLKTGRPVIVVANALLYYALIMQFFQDQYFSLMSQWIQILGWTYIFDKLYPVPRIVLPLECPGPALPVGAVPPA